ncbi:2-phospho-L-lactate transferase [Sphingobium aquiterrae]|uniref:2-phospho-L-lactate transferase n=1 Tax=Sphingobium aquiterrae TaxID=2038656 RepID=UPI00301A94B6
MILALAGGVGGAKLADGLARILPPDALAIAVNTGDDSEHFGLLVSPDVDTVMYTLAGIANPVTAWGLADESWEFMAAVERLGGPDWFRLGDRDLATKAERTRRLHAGDTLTAITRDLAHALGVRHALFPMTDDPVRTVLETDEGTLAFHDYFVRRRCAPRVRGLSYAGVEQATPSPALSRALASPALEAIILCPSNPYLSIAPILALPGVRAAMKRRGVPIVAVSPIVAGAAIKGPLARMMADFDISVSPRGIAALYDGLIDGIVIDRLDADRNVPDVEVHATNIVMADAVAREQVAREVVDFARRLL